MPDIDQIVAQNDSLHTQLAQAIETKNHDRLPLIAAAIAQSNAHLREFAEAGSTSEEAEDTTAD